MKKHLLLAAIGSAVIISGCASSEPDKYDVESYEPLTDPAVLYCVNQGGELERASEEGLRVTYCKMSEEELVEVQAYYQQHLDQQQAEE
jgi:putative hemolysin